jgi:hypothetical protein
MVQSGSLQVKLQGLHTPPEVAWQKLGIPCKSQPSPMTLPCPFSENIVAEGEMNVTGMTFISLWALPSTGKTLIKKVGGKCANTPRPGASSP